ncbi:MAG: 8-oxo-dGTP diphosphatase MutT [Gammaproteobacteria bacterium]|nr:MAG: 8-oxo-dGTP diphosphatase MutT [Gammaproteobacteria bacterium]
MIVQGNCCDRSEKVLIAKRPDHVHQGGLWEFPGGKVEAGESVQAALIREIEEEIGIVCDAAGLCPWLKIQHQYLDKAVLLDVWRVTAFSGEPFGKEGQRVRWVSLPELANYTFPDANRKIITLLQRSTQPRHLDDAEAAGLDAETSATGGWGMGQ